MTTMNVSNQATFIPEIWAARALGFLHQNAVMPRLVNRNWETEVASYGDTINIPTYGSFTVKDKVPGYSVELQNATSGTIPIVLDQHKEISFIIEDVAKAQANISIMDGYIEKAMIAHAEAIDSALLLAGYASLPAANRFGNGSTAFSEANLLLARRKLNTNQIPYGNRHLVMKDFAPLLVIDRFTRADAIGNGQAIQTAQVGTLHGATCWEDPRVWELGTSPVGIHNLYFHRDGITLCTRPLPSPEPGTGVKSYTAQLDGVGLRVLYGFNMSALGYQITIDILYGIKVVSTDYLTEIVSSN